jgi:hypothetical protein
VVLAQRRRATDTLDLFAMLAVRDRELPPVVAEQLALLDAARMPQRRFDRGANPSHAEPMVAECFTSTERSGQTA